MGNCQDTKLKQDEKQQINWQNDQVSACPFHTNLRKPAPDFQAVGYFQGVKKINLADYRGKYVVLFFFPFDYNEACQQEILSFSDQIQQFKDANCEVLGCSIDSQFVHMQYCQKPRSEGGLGGLTYPLIADIDRNISKSYGVLIEEGEEKGASYRATFILDKNGLVRHSSVNDIAGSIDVKEILRLVQAFQDQDKFGKKYSSPSQDSKTVSSHNSSSKKETKPLKEKKDNSQNNSFSSSSSNDESKLEEKKDNFLSPLNEKTEIVVVQKRASSLLNTNLLSAGSGAKPGGPRPSILKQTQNLNLMNSQQDAVRAPNNQRKRSILKKSSLCTRFGGEDQVKRIIDNFFEIVLNDGRINFYFQNIDIKRLKQSTADYMIQLLGGTPGYKGKDLMQAHESLSITDMQFEAFSEDLEKAFLDFGADEECLLEIFQFIAPLREQIVNKNKKSLIERIGGQQKFDQIIHKVNEKFQLDDKVKNSSNKLDFNSIKKLQFEFFEKALSSEGYNGRGMREVHKQHGLTDQQFELFIEILQQAFVDQKINGGITREVIVMFDPAQSLKFNKGLQIPLYEQLGGMKNIDLIVLKFYNRLLTDPRIKEFFINIDMQKQKDMQKSFLYFIFGTPVQYSGKNLRDAHMNLELQDMHYDAFKENLIETLTEHKIDYNIIIEVDILVESLRRDIVSVTPPLIERLGGSSIIEKTVDTFMTKASNDKRVKEFFKPADNPKLRDHIKKYFILMFGGPNNYTGRSLRGAHYSLNLTDMHYNIVKDLFLEAFKENQTSPVFILEIGRLLETYRQEIVARKSSLFESIGGERTIQIIIQKLFEKIMKDQQLFGFFKNCDLPKLKEHLRHFFTFIFGGPNKYKGKNIRDAHQRLQLTDLHFSQFKSHFMHTVAELGFEIYVIQDIEVLIEAMRGECVKRPETLLDRIGEKKIQEAIAIFTDKLHKDSKIGVHFSKANMSNLKESMTKFFIMILGGQNKYTGKNMKEAHQHCNLSGQAFDQFKSLLKDSLKEQKVEENNIKEFINLIETLRSEVVGNRPQTMVDRVGGESELEKVVNKFIDKIEKHPTISPFFKKVNFKKHRKNMFDYLSSVLGGTDRYKGKGLKEVHWRHCLNNAHFDVFKEIFIETLNEFNLDIQLIREIGSFWESLRGQVVQKKQQEEQNGDNNNEDD